MIAKLSFATLATPDEPLEEVLRLAVAHGFAGVDLRFSNHKGEVQPGAGADAQERVATAVRAAGLQLASLFCYPAFPMEATDPWTVYAADVAEAMSVGAALGAHAVRIFTPKLRDGLDSADVLERSAAICRRVLENAAAGPLLLVQNHNGHCDARQAAHLAEQIGHARFGLAFSPDHVVLMREGDWDEVLARALPWTRQLYVADIRTDGHTSVGVLPGEGEVPLRAIIQACEAQGFAGYYTLKWERLWNPRLAGPEIALPRFVEFMRGG